MLRRPPRPSPFPYPTLFRSDLLKKVLASATFGEGYATLEYVEAAMIDLGLHEGTKVPKPADVMTFEEAALRHAGAWYPPVPPDRKSTRLNSSHMSISYAVFG